MSARPLKQQEETIIPLGVVFITVGLIILLTAAVIWVVAPQQLPEHLQLAVAPLRTPAVTAPVSSAPAAVLLPETPLDSDSGRALPSFAAADTAPTFYAPLPGQPTRLVIPRIDLDAPVYRVDLEEITYEGQRFLQWLVPLSRAAGWHSDSALAGQSGNTVLNGHHNIYGEVFRHLVDLKIGDQIILYAEEDAYYYTVQEHLLLPERGQPAAVRQANAAWIEASDDERLTLVTCWPYTDNSHRLIIVAVPAAKVNS